MFRFGIQALLIVSLAGCASTTRQEALQSSVTNYVKAIRRGQAEIALAYVKPEKRLEIGKNLERFENDLRLSQVEVKNISPDEKFQTATVTVLMEYFDQFSIGVTTTQASFLWKYDEKLKGWFIDSSPSFIK